MKKISILLILLFPLLQLMAEDGYRLWLRYEPVTDGPLLQQYRAAATGLLFSGNNPTLSAARQEIINGLQGLLGKKIPLVSAISEGALVAGTPASSPQVSSLNIQQLGQAGNEGFIIRSVKSGQKNITVIAANTDIGVMYGVFHFLRLIKTNQNIRNLDILSKPMVKNRVLNHWDNLDRTVERGYAGFSIWDWHKLPDYKDPRYVDYARANASIGINGTVLTNVNANALVLTKEYLVKVAALADIFRPYGLKVYLTARFSAPVEIGGLKTADPMDAAVQAWWKQKATEIYSYVPDFGGFLVKANSEGQPGPQNYGRNHADGANMLADAVSPHGGIIMWRAFVYSNESPDDRFKQAYTEFKPLDGKFRENVLIQVKNGPIDFQPREPFHPLFGAMPKTPIMMEFQLTQEYLGFATHLVFLPSMFKECLDADTYVKGKGSTVAKVIDGSLDGHSLSGMAAVTNIGNDRNWTGHPFAQSNWYSLGRLAWNHSLSTGELADEWIRQTFSNKKETLDKLKQMMLVSHETMVNYMTPLGLNHIMGYGHHYGPAPWYDKAARADWNPVYFHKADAAGIGFNRTATGSNALEQYAPEVRKIFGDPATCPEEFLLWFHHLPWDHKMASGKTLWDELCYRYQSGVDSVRGMQRTWNSVKSSIDPERFAHVQMLLNIQVKEAVWWRDACLVYFQTFSKRPFPAGVEKPEHTLEYYKSLAFPFAPGN
jgi:alpha-glucuronidase